MHMSLSPRRYNFENQEMGDNIKEDSSRGVVIGMGVVVSSQQANAQELQKLQDKLSSLKTKYDSLKVAFAKLQQDYKEKQKENNSSKEQIDELQASLEQIRFKLSTTLSKLTETEEAVTAQKEINKKLENRITETEELLTAQNEINKKLRNRVTETEQSLGAQKEINKKKLENRVAETEQSLGAQKDISKKLENRVKQQSSDISSLSAKTIELEMKMELTQEDLNERENQIDSARKQLGQMSFQKNNFELQNETMIKEKQGLLVRQVALDYQSHVFRSVFGDPQEAEAHSIYNLQDLKIWITENKDRVEFQPQVTKWNNLHVLQSVINITKMMKKDHLAIAHPPIQISDIPLVKTAISSVYDQNPHRKQYALDLASRLEFLLSPNTNQ